jgi:hypothetical protein
MEQLHCIIQYFNKLSVLFLPQHSTLPSHAHRRHRRVAVGPQIISTIVTPRPSLPPTSRVMRSASLGMVQARCRSRIGARKRLRLRQVRP